MKKLILFILFLSIPIIAQDFGFRESKVDTTYLRNDIDKNTDSSLSHNTRILLHQDSLNVHTDTSLSHNTRINAARQLTIDSIGTHRTELNLHKDSLNSHDTRILANLDSVKRHTDSLLSHNTRINSAIQLTKDSISTHRTELNLNKDSLTSHNTRILLHQDSLKVHTDTALSHNTRILLYQDSLKVHTDTALSHNTRILALLDSAKRHTDTLLSHNTRILAKDSVILGHTWAISGEIKVPSGDTDFLNGFFIDLPSGQTAKIVRARYTINSGTSATVKLQKKNGSDPAGDITGWTSISVDTSNGTLDGTDTSLSSGDEIKLVVTAVSGTPKNMSFTVFIKYEF